MEKLKLASGQKFSAIEHYLNAAGKYISYDAPANFIAYGEAKGMVYLYINRSSWKAVDELDELIMNGDSDKARELFPKVCKELSKSMKD